ncbi:DEAD/DEAH box helicase [Halorussus sp. AFM4]|uniref:DEAD/DEAH box helicase n=1 Tax=Halorussus sp. AFM4 TaxID=3421651 RepID=UPI003EBFE305
MSESGTELSKLVEAGLPKEYVDYLLEQRGVDSLWEPQLQAINEGILEEDNFLVVSEAGTGKTLLAEFVIFHQNIHDGGCGVFLVPFKPLAEEKIQDFTEGLSDKFGMEIDSSIGSDITPPQELFENNIVVLTYEKFNYYLRNHPDVVGKKTSTVVVDEFQIINDETRGPVLETTITKLLHDYGDLKIVGLSATAANPDEISDWIDGNYIDCRGWRPNPLYEGIYAAQSDEITFYHEDDEESEPCQNDLLSNFRENAIADYLLRTASQERDRQALVFASTRSAAQNTAEQLADFINSHPKAYDFAIDEAAADELSQEIKSSARRTGPNIETLATCVKWGTAFYHAGLDSAVRSVIERGFKDGVIRTLSSTSNLGAGINLPVDRVFIRHPRYGSSYSGTEMTTAEYKNLAGRAGRYNYTDRRGESILFAEDFTEKLQYKNTYINGDLEEISSQIKLGEDLDLMLDLIRGYQTPNLIYSFLEDSLFGQQSGLTKPQVEAVITETSIKLEEYDMVDRADGGLTLTKLGKATSKQLVSPKSVHMIRNFLETISSNESIQKEDLFTIICGTPECQYLRLYHKKGQTNLRTSELRRRYDMQDLADNEITAAYTSACVVADWLEGMSLEDAFEKYSVIDSRTPADVYERLAPEMARVLRTVTRVLEAADSELFDALGEEVERLADQLQYGLDEAGVSFARAGIATSRNEVRALREKLDIETIEELADCDISDMKARMGTDDAVRAKRGAVDAVYDGREAEAQHVLLTAAKRELSSSSFERLLNSHTDEFETTCVNLLDSVEELFVEPADEDGRTREPECRMKIKLPDGNYLETKDGRTMTIAVECKSKKNFDNEVTAKKATAVKTKAPDAPVKLTVGTPSFVDGVEDDAISNDVLLMPATAFGEFVARAINGEATREIYQELFGEPGLIDLEEVREAFD